MKRRNFRRIGSSIGITIPAEFCRAHDIRPDDTTYIYQTTNGGLIFHPIKAVAESMFLNTLHVKTPKKRVRPRA